MYDNHRMVIIYTVCIELLLWVTTCFISFSYCLSTEDTSNDTKWTKIQQRCLISERAGHCSNVSTPRAERTLRESRRLKEVQLQNKKQQKLKEKEEGKKKDADSAREREEDGQEVTDENKNSADDVGECRKEAGGVLSSLNKSEKVVTLKSRRSLKFPRTDVKTVKSPTVKITRIASRQRHVGFPKTLKLTGNSKTSEIQASNVTTSTRSAVELDQACQQVKFPTNGGLAGDTLIQSSPTTTRTNSIREDDSLTRERGDMIDLSRDSSTTMELSSSAAMSPASLSGVSFRLEESLTSPSLRRSPRLTTRALCDGNGGDGGKERENKTDRKKEKSLKAVSLVYPVYTYVNTQLYIFASPAVGTL